MDKLELSRRGGSNWREKGMKGFEKLVSTSGEITLRAGLGSEPCGFIGSFRSGQVLGD